MRNRTRFVFLSLGLGAALLSLLFLMLQQVAPHAARLLPEADAVVFLNVKLLRTATHLDRTPVQRSPDFQHFIDATGIVPERDLDAAAFAIHRMADPTGPNGPVAFSEVFEGRFDGDRLGRYLASIASGRETYAGHVVYTIPIEGRTLRLVQLGSHALAASNMPTTEQIHGMVDRDHFSVNPFSGSSLVSGLFGSVPLFSGAWGIGRLGLPFAENGRISVNGLALPFSPDAEFVASLRYTTSLHLRIEQIAASESDAARSTDQLKTLLQIFHTLQQASPSTPSLQKFTDSIRIEQHKDRSIVTADIPAGALSGLTATN